MHIIQHFTLEVLILRVWRLFFLFSEYIPSQKWFLTYHAKVKYKTNWFHYNKWKRAGKIVKLTTGNEMHTIQHFSLEVLLPCVWRLFLLFSEYNPPPTWLRIYLGAKRAFSLNASVTTTLNCKEGRKKG